MKKIPIPLLGITLFGAFLNCASAEEKVVPEIIDPKNLVIRFDKIEGREKGEKNDSTIGCYTTIYTTKSNANKMTVTFGIANYSDSKEIPFIIYQPLSQSIDIYSVPDKNRDMHWGDIVKGLILQPTGLGYKPEKGWVEFESGFKSDHLIEERNIPFKKESSILQDSIVVKEEPFLVGFTKDIKEESSVLGFSWWKIVNRPKFIFKINPKGLIKKEDKEKYLACKAEILNKNIINK